MKISFLYSNSKTVKFRPNEPHKRPGQNFCLKMCLIPLKPHSTIHQNWLWTKLVT